jgi:spore maturation protein CgeB
MNVLIIGKFSAGQFGFHISDTLKDMGHSNIEFDPTLKYKYSRTTLGRRVHQLNHIIVNNLINTQYFKERRKNRLANILGDQKIDLTICTHDFLFHDEVDLIKAKSKSPVVLWFPDSFASFNKAFFLIADYDALFFKDPYIVKVLRDQYNKLNAYYLPECCNPKYHKSINLNDDDRKEYGCDITTYGSPHNIRTSFFVQLLNYDYNIKIWGNQPPIWLKDKKAKSLYTGVYVFNENKCKAVLAAKININTLLPGEVIGLNARTFETAGIGGFQIIQWRPGLAQLFNDGKELISFKNFDNLKTTISYFLDNEKERYDIAKRGQLRTYKEHTYQLRIQLMFDTIFNNKVGYEMPEFYLTG